MYLVCRDCERQYDVGAMEPGSKFLCHCGSYVPVPRVTVRDVVVNRCPTCGASLGAGAKACEYCNSEISLAELSLGEACPKCLSRMFKDALFCSTCGLEIRPERLDPTALEGPCPRCETSTLLDRRVERGKLTECARCSGIWLAAGLFEKIVEQKDESAMTEFTRRGVDGTRHPLDPSSGVVRYLACPVCGERMHRTNFGRASGVILDTCKDHGYWFDPFELERVFEFVRSGGLDIARRRRIEELEDQARRARDRAGGSAPPLDLGPYLNRPDRRASSGDDIDFAVTGPFESLFRWIRWLFSA